MIFGVQELVFKRIALINKIHIGPEISAVNICCSVNFKRQAEVLGITMRLV